MLIPFLIKRLRERYRPEGVVIPYPIRTLDIPDRLLERIVTVAS